MHALVSVTISMTIIVLLMIRQVLRHRISEAKIDSFADLLPQFIVLVTYGLPAAIFLIKDKERLRSVGITTHNLWQASLIGFLLAGTTLVFGEGGPEGVLHKIQPQRLLSLVYFAFVGFGEEFLFRGYLQNRAVAWLGTWRGWLLASVVMAIVHFPHRLLFGRMTVLEATIASAALIPVSLLMGFVMLRTKNIVAPGLFHTFANWTSNL
ncbi:MAG TPA: hypothetical protein DCX07_03280 [Phycisphaerales bacterium]|nr:hypothetical protein [Phycisphaerales bacterium]